MGLVQKIIVNTISILCLVALVVLIVENGSIHSELVLPNSVHLSITSSVILLIGSVLAIVPVLLRQLCIAQSLRTEVKQFELRREKAEVRAETSQDQIRVLESKIQTLEKALEQALSSPRQER